MDKISTPAVNQSIPLRFPGKTNQNFFIGLNKNLIPVLTCLFEEKGTLLNRV